MDSLVRSAGQSISIRSELGWVGRVVDEMCGRDRVPANGDEADLVVRIDRSRSPFRTDGWAPLVRGAWARAGDVVVEDVCTTGFDMHVSIRDGRPHFVFRWRPPPRTRAAFVALRSRWHLLARAVLLQFPSMWWAETRGVSPVHAAVCTAGDITPLIGGPAGVGKTTLVMNELSHGERATSDNLNVVDGTSAWGVMEPVRIEGAGGRKMPHGRGEMKLPNRVDSLVPDCVAILERTVGPGHARVISSHDASRALITGTFMAGELRRYWPYAATLAAGTGVGPPGTQLSRLVMGLTERLPCVAVAFPRAGGTRLATLLEGVPRPNAERRRPAMALAEGPSR